MKKLLLILFCLPFILNAQQLNFDSHFTVSSSSDGYGRPRVAIINNNPIVIWRKDSTPKKLRASKWNGNSFDAAYDITSSGVLPSSWDGPEIASKGDTIYVVFTSASTTQSSIMLIRSFDGGVSFSDTIRVSENNPSHKFRMGNIVIDKLGNPIVSYMQYLLNWTEPKQIVNRSLNSGNNFLGGVEGSLFAPGEPCDCCKSSMVVDNDDLYLLFRNNHNNERNSYVSKSTDGGLTFSFVADLDDYDWMLNSCPATSPKGVIFDDSLLVVRRSGATGNNEVVYNKTNKLDLNYSYNRNIDPIIGKVQDFPEIAANGDSVFIVWQDNRNNIPNCFLSYSLNGVENLSLGISFTDSTILGSKVTPHVAFKNNLLHLVYVDNSSYSIKYIKASIGNFTSVNEQFNLNKIKLNFDLLGRITKAPFPYNVF